MGGWCIPILVHKCSLVNFWFIECICMHTEDLCLHWMHMHAYWRFMSALNAYACILKIYVWNFVGDIAWGGGGVPAQTLWHLYSLSYSGFLQSVIGVNAATNALHSANKVFHSKTKHVCSHTQFSYSVQQNDSVPIRVNIYLYQHRYASSLHICSIQVE